MFNPQRALRACKYLNVSLKSHSAFMIAAESTSCGVLKEGEDPKNVSKDEWKKRLTPLEYAITRNADTERPHTGEYNKHFEEGTYVCICCGSELFESDAKFQTSCGWPAFSAAKNEEDVKRRQDTSFNCIRTEVLCSKCNAHLGHVFDDGPRPSRERYCINSVSLKFKKKMKEKEEQK